MRFKVLKVTVLDHLLDFSNLKIRVAKVDLTLLFNAHLTPLPHFAFVIRLTTEVKLAPRVLLDNVERRFILLVSSQTQVVLETSVLDKVEFLFLQSSIRKHVQECIAFKIRDHRIKT
jgi:hypothetical protein